MNISKADAIEDLEYSSGILLEEHERLAVKKKFTAKQILVIDTPALIEFLQELSY